MIKRYAAVLFLTLMLVGASIGNVFADTATVPVHINVAESTVSFSITEKITMTAAAGSPVLSVEDLVISNTGTMGQIRLDSLSVTAENGWTLVDGDEDFVNMAVNAKKFSLSAENKDFAVSGTVKPGLTARVGGTMTVHFTGKTGASTEAVSDLQIAEITATVSLV